MWPSKRLVGFPGAFTDEVTVRLGEYEARAEPVNARETKTPAATSLSRINLLINVSFPRSHVHKTKNRAPS
jgi:hypothetical protein